MARHVFRNRLGELIEIPEVAATQAKNTFASRSTAWRPSELLRLPVTT